MCGIAAWFGFCAVYFTVAGNEAKSIFIRITSWVVAVGCLFILGLTISRGPLFAFAVASIVSLRHLIRRAFVPFLLLLIISWICYESGLFEHIGAGYAARGVEKTGRLEVWPLAVERFLEAPLGGVGVSNMAIQPPGISQPVTPHNGFILFALASGIIPLIFFLGFWWRGVLGVFHAIAARQPDAAFHLPLLIYAFLITLQLNMPFTLFWMVTTLCAATAVDAPSRVRRVIVGRFGRRPVAKHVKLR